MKCAHSRKPECASSWRGAGNSLLELRDWAILKFISISFWGLQLTQHAGSSVSLANAINDSGEIAGWNSYNSNTNFDPQAFLYSNGTMQKHQLAVVPFRHRGLWNKQHRRSGRNRVSQPFECPREVTTDVYMQAVSPQKREAQSKLVKMVMKTASV